ncbi:chain-length determining protein [Paramesorhizobium deserti]|uniref:Chain-length determining protein n=1 Tax=Paramesorhizobium deserti TaxID=1494590 RepID=A0A135HWW5_9HYPH|nr:Wzz/FepE/Etk N-terminal domain-containing protein [Paramesorhizobium deserti]KXF77683.1 chain-length determining protein [Paramesorhizobium deserti]
MSGAGSVGNDVDIDLGALFGSLRRHWLFILAGALVLAALALLFCLLSTPEYRAETRILIETRESVFTRPNGETAADRPVLDQEGVKSQVEVITSSDLLKKVGASLKLAETDEFGRPSLLSRGLIALGLKPDPAKIGGNEYMLREMREHLQVYNVPDSRVIVVQFSSEDPALAAKVSNAIGDEYIALQRAAKLQSTDDATGWLEPEIADLTKRVKDAEAKVANYRASSDLLVGQNDSPIANQQLSDISSELSRVRANRAASEARAASIRAALQTGAALDTVPDIVSSGLMQRLRERQIQLNAQIADLSTSLLDGHPRIRALRSQLSDLNQQIRAEGRKILESLENEASLAKLREVELTRELNTMKAQAARAGDQEVELRALQREATAQRELLQTYLTRYREAASRTDRNYLPVDARVFSRADTPAEPYFPKTLAIVSATFFAGLLLLSIFVLLRELFSGRAMRPVEGVAQAPANEIQMPAAAAEAAEPASEGAVTEEKTAPRPSYAAPPPASVETIQQIYDSYTTLGEDVPENPHSVHAVASRLIELGMTRGLVVSPEGDDGSAASVHLTRELADRKLRSILIDMTGTGAISRAMLDGKEMAGITDLLASEKQFTDVIHSDHYSDAHVMPLGLADPERAMRAVDRLPIILDALEAAYDAVIVESGPSTAENVKRLIGTATQVILSVVDPDNNAVALSALDLDENGLDDVLILMGAEPDVPTPPSGGEKKSGSQPTL